MKNLVIDTVIVYGNIFAHHQIVTKIMTEFSIIVLSNNKTAYISFTVLSLTPRVIAFIDKLRSNHVPKKNNSL